MPSITPDIATPRPVGALIRDLRTQLGMTQRELARRRGATGPSQARLEKGGDTHLSTIIDNAVALGGSVTVTFAHPDSVTGATQTYGYVLPDLAVELRETPGLFLDRAATALAAIGDDPDLLVPLRVPLRVALAEFPIRFATDWATAEESFTERWRIDPEFTDRRWQTIQHDVWAHVLDGAANALSDRLTCEQIVELFDRYDVHPNSSPPNGDQLNPDDPIDLWAHVRWDTWRDLSRYRAYIDAGMPRLDEAVALLASIAKDPARMQQFWVAVGHDIGEPTTTPEPTPAGEQK